MSKGKILVIEPDSDIRYMLKVYFSGQGYNIFDFDDAGNRIKDVIEIMPDLIILDTNSDESAELEFFNILRSDSLVKNIPIITLTNNQFDDSKYLRIGEDYFLSKPFDIEELKLRISNILGPRFSRISSINPISGFRVGDYIEESINELLQKQVYEWIYIDFKMQNLDTFKEVYDWHIRDGVIRNTAIIIQESLATYSTQEDFVGHVGIDNFIVVSHLSDVQALIDAIVERFNQDLPKFHSEDDIKRGHMLLDDKEYPLMKLAYGICKLAELEEEQIYLRTIVELGADDRRRRFPGRDTPPKNDDPPILTTW